MLALFSQLLLWWFLPHGELDDKIRLLSAQIDANPHDMTLREMRGELYVLDEIYDLAINDFVVCMQHPPVSARAFAGYSKALFYTHRPDSALLMINHAIGIDGSQVSYYEWKAVVLEDLEEYCEAANAQQRFLDQIQFPGPAVYLQLADYWMACEKGNEKAFDVLEKGVSALPGNSVLLKKLVLSLIAKHDYFSALHYQNQLVDHASFKARYLLERSGIYILLDQKENAIDDLYKALSELDVLPQKKKDLEAIQKLKGEIIALLNKYQP